MTDQALQQLKTATEFLDESQETFKAWLEAKREQEVGTIDAPCDCPLHNFLVEEINLDVAVEVNGQTLNWGEDAHVFLPGWASKFVCRLDEYYLDEHICRLDEDYPDEHLGGPIIVTGDQALYILESI